MGTIRCRETSVRNYHYSLRNNPEESSSHLLRCGSLQYTRAGVVEHRPTVYTRALLLVFEYYMRFKLSYCLIALLKLFIVMQ